MSLNNNEYDDYDDYDEYDDYDDEYDGEEYDGYDDTYYEDYSQEGVIPVLRYTPNEIFALRVYESSSTEVWGPLSKEPKSAYRTINTLLFPGIDNELARIFDDGYTSLNCMAIRDPNELLGVATNLYSAMYKFGKQLDSPIKTKRVDREASILPMKQKGEVVSNFSTTLQPEFDMLFSKSNMVLMETEIQPGAVCGDFQKIFDSVNAVYNMYTEEEVLIAPFSPIEIEELELSEEEKQMRDQDGNPPVGKYKVTVKSLPKAEPLTEKEHKHYKRMLKIFEDPIRQEDAADFLERLQYIRQDYGDISKSSALKNFSEHEIQRYIEWKEAFQAVLRYRTREIALEIDRGLEEAENAKIQMLMSQATDGTLLTQLDDMAQTRTLTGLNSGISKTKKEVSKETDPKDDIKAK